MLKRVASTLKWPSAGGACILCRSGLVEDARHFVLGCPALSVHRERFCSILQPALRAVGVAGAQLWSMFHVSLLRGSGAALELIAGACPSLQCPRGHDVSDFEEECGKAYFIFDKVSKDYLVCCWRARGARVGIIRVVRHTLVHSPPCSPVSFTYPSPVRLLSVLDRDQWEPFVRLYRVGSSTPVRVKCKKRSNFFVVKRGRVEGIFYRWCDAFAAVAGFPGGSVKGFASLLEAEYAWQNRA